MKENKVINVSFIGGIIGLFNTPRRRLEKAIQRANKEGWAVRQVQSGNPNIVFLLLSLILLIITLFLYMPTPGYMVILEREKGLEDAPG